jgi:hypothetical protein
MSISSSLAAVKKCTRNSKTEERETLQNNVPMHTREDMVGRVVGCETVRFGLKSCGPLIRSHGVVRQKNTFCM